MTPESAGAIGAPANSNIGQIDHRRNIMLQWALIFLIVAIIAGAFGLSGVAGAATQIAWILFIIGLVLAVIFFIRGRGSRIP
jgi:uncharacterized membrane protein YtjA (UPF0391 family)